MSNESAAPASCRVLLDWTFEPANCLEQALAVSVEGHTISMEDGHAGVEMDAEAFDARPELRGRFREAIEARLRAAQLFTREPFRLEDERESRVHSDGRIDRVIALRGVAMVMSVGRVDFQTVDKDGNVVSDSKADRLRAKRETAERIGNRLPRDPLLDAVLRSQEMSLKDPSNELIHLYEIWEALRNHFGGQKAVLQALAIPDSARSAFTGLCNDAPVKQGRHRGAHVGELRDATDAELDTARGFARRLIDAYVATPEAVQVVAQPSA